MNLTPKQLKILTLIRDSRVRRGFSPTMQELADQLNVSKVTVFEHVEALIKKGALEREPNKARSLSIPEGISLPDEEREMSFPLVGKIADTIGLRRTILGVVLAFIGSLFLLREAAGIVSLGGCFFLVRFLG